MRINSKKTCDITLKCIPVIFSITAFGGTYQNKPFQLLEVCDKVYFVKWFN